MIWLPTSQASAALFLHRNTLHKYRREGLFKAGTHWIRKGPWRNAGYLPLRRWLMTARKRSRSGPLTHHCVFSLLTAQGCTGLNVICRAM